ATHLMAEPSTSYINIGSSPPIAKIAQDHLFTILLLLPIDSILSFAMTCKRFNTLTTSDTLWESICRREWGSTSVDALKSSMKAINQQLVWMRIYKQVSKLDSVTCHKLSDPDAEMVLPSPRASHSLNFVSDCLVLFGGGCEGGRHLDDTWLAYVGNDFQMKLKWQKINAGVPSGRFGHTCVVIGDKLVLFGGINDRGFRHNDTWVGQVVSSENLECISLSWKLLELSSNVAPPPRGAHAACCIDKRKLAILGGIGLDGVRLGDTWVLELSEDLCFGAWREVVTHPSPPPRSGHSLACIEGIGAVLFGGRGLGYEVLHDVWLLQMLEGEGTWVQLLYGLQNIAHGFSLPRVGHSAIPILGGRLLIYGGEDSYRHRKDDFWVLDISAVASTEVQPTALISKTLQPNMWRRVKAQGYKPNSRSFHRACIDRSGQYLYVFGGMVDGLLNPAEASGLRFDGELFLVQLLTQL
ncbi:hypothetical protein Tsubulata_026129, partial [Turnera subulata]